MLNVEDSVSIRIDDCTPITRQGLRAVCLSTWMRQVRTLVRFDRKHRLRAQHLFAKLLEIPKFKISDKLPAAIAHQKAPSSPASAARPQAHAYVVR